MKQVIQSRRTGKLSVKTIPSPKVRSGHILVQTRTSLISAGTEKLAIDFAKMNIAKKAKARPDLVKKVLETAKKEGVAATFRKVMSRLDEPLPLGYSAAGNVVAVGAGLEGQFAVDSRVAIAGAGVANHAELNLVPANLAVPILNKITDEEACYGTLGAIALHSVRNLKAHIGDIVCVIGAGLIGLLAIRLLVLSGVRAIAVDYSSERLAIAEKFGAEAVFKPSDNGLKSSIYALSGGRGCDAILNAASTKSNQPLELSGLIARDRARIVMVGFTGTEFPYRTFMSKELNLIISRSYGPGRYDSAFEEQGVKYPEGWVRWTETENIREIIRLMSPHLQNRLDVSFLTTHRFSIDQAEDAYDMVIGGHQSSLGVIVTYPGERKPLKTINFHNINSEKTYPKKCIVGVIGAGQFSSSIILPALKKNSEVILHTLVSLRGATAEHGKNNFKFLNSETNENSVFESSEINAIIIATNHDTHADYTSKALAAEKSVLVEKPLALNYQELNQVVVARNSSNAFFQVGFNRRFAPLVLKLMDAINKKPGPRVVLIRVNAGFVDPEHWVNLEHKGGGRILGEVCHFVDLTRLIAQSPIVAVQAETVKLNAGLSENISVQLTFYDGSLGTIVYTALGDSAMPKELIEVYVGGMAVVLQDYQELIISSEGKKIKNTYRQDKGLNGSINAFVNAVCFGGTAPIDEFELVETSHATLAVLEALRCGKKISLDESN